MTENSKVKRSLFQTSYTMFSMFHTISISIKSYIYIIGGLRVISEIKGEGLNLAFNRVHFAEIIKSKDIAKDQISLTTNFLLFLKS